MGAFAAIARKVGVAPVVAPAPSVDPIARARALGWHIEVRPSGLLIDARNGPYDPNLLDELAALSLKDDPSTGGAESLGDHVGNEIS
ncbi:MAG TPA: hypothetical protein VNS22_11530 [Geminicoccus sp.]|uniref:hypothetical protein n=1 Tax=Geminicoccus sp. TaxID=2024832 RepID=UPI002CE5147F|nr:hypothetical protein [Geminicoccus sp.]HWL69002.1 hypothetical protein [Geminicoccus sp.]